MEKFINFKGHVVPLFIKDIDTDMIIPAQFLTSISKNGYGQNLFKRLKDSDPSFPLNLPKYQNSSILVAGSNFGCGSSREHAVWALLGANIKIVIAPSFADIFYNNSGKNGLLLINLTNEECAQLSQNAIKKDFYISIDLEKQQIVDDSGYVYAFNIDPFKKHCFINGFDEFDYLDSHTNEITDYFSKMNI